MATLSLLCCITLLNAQSSRKIKLNPVSLGFDLPQTYKERTFIKGLAGFVNNIDQLNIAIHQADELSSKALNEQRDAENRETVIVTFKNKDGKALEIKSLEELSPEKLQALGFDVEILKERRN